jgi:hypothetical protein
LSGAGHSRCGSGRGVRDHNGDASVLAGLLNSGDSGGLVGGLACALYTRLYGVEEGATLLAMASKVGEARAAVRLQSTEKAAQLDWSKCLYK